MLSVTIFFFKQKTAYEMLISDWSSDVCSSDLHRVALGGWPGKFQKRISRKAAKNAKGPRRPRSGFILPAIVCGNEAEKVAFRPSATSSRSLRLCAKQ